MKLRDKRFRYIAGAALMAAVVYWGYDQWREARAGKEVKQMTEKMVTYCVGRYLIDLPQDTEVNYGATRIDGVDIAYLELDIKQPRFEQRLAAREDDLSGQKNQKGRPSLESAELINHSGLTGKILKHSYESIELDEGNKKILAEGNTVEAWIKSVGAEYRLTGGSLDKKYIGNVSRLASKLRSVPSKKIPTDPGFCIEHGIILDPPGLDQNESIVLHFRLKKNPDVVGNLFITSIGSSPRETLLQRDAKVGLDVRVNSIFKGDRTINGIPGQEVSEKVKEMNGTKGHSFTWEAFGKPNDTFAPAISFDISTGYGPPGKPLNSSLPDKAANELWQKISGSIRLRPTGPAKTSAAEPTPTDGNGATKRLPLGTQVSSLRSCPETGVYQCPADAPGITQHRVFLQQYRPMPAAFVIEAKRGVARFLSEPESKEVETIWTLVAYSDEKT